MTAPGPPRQFRFRASRPAEPVWHRPAISRSRGNRAADLPRHRRTAPQCGVASDAVLDRLEAAFSKRRAELLASDAGRWALFVQPADRRRRPEFVGCYDTETEACEIGYRSPVGRRFLVKAVLEEDPVISIPWAVPADQL